ncbi:DUF4383 domain-containing protein [Microlunatus parietis]|uniref:DUF4383 domain-containing protein n=1 Tax=Microlunatus parietis TaxID=682979 RepID=A0A7Y9LAJ7_9ACTN|nr:DUF4383 domain-containing protein [Microlunatus parietis]NYE72914.1 hypothetical protein [Microlunatus parietis]
MATPANRPAAGTLRRSPVQTASLVVGALFLLVGILGFIPGITTNYDTMSFASHHSEALLLGLFQVSILHNIVHLAFGIVGIVAARGFRTARGFLIIGGIVYLLLFIYGLVVPMESAANFIPVNTADNVLHVVLGVGMIALGLVLGRTTTDGGREPA